VVLGQTVAADAELYRVANLAQVSLTLSLQPADAGRIRPGAEVTVRAAGREAQAKISFVSPALDEKTRLVPVIATLDNRDGRWRVGEPVTASVTLTGTGTAGITVPTTAIQTINGKPAVFVRIKNGFRVTPVVLGDAAGTMTVVRSGLSAGDQIATTNSFTLKAEIGKGEAGRTDSMIATIVNRAVDKRWLVLLLTALAALVGAWALWRLPIDAVPDITNNQVQINVRAPALSPELVEKQVAFPIETALAGIPGLEYTRSLSRNGFAQVTAVFSDKSDIYFARQQVGERLTGVKENLPSGVNPEMGPIATGLGEVYMWTIRLDHRGDDKHVPGEPGIQPDGSYITPEGDRLTSEADKATYLRTAQDWIVAPLLKNTPGLAGVDSIGGYAKQFLVVPDVQKLASMGLTLSDLANALEKNNTSVGGGFVERNGEGLAVRSDALVRNAAELARVVVSSRNGVPITLDQVASVRNGQAIRMGSASENGSEVVVGTAIMRIGENSRTVATAVADRLAAINASLPPDVVVQPVLDRTALVNSTIKTVAKNLAEGALLVIVVLFALLGNVRAALIAAVIIPVTMLLTGFGMLKAGVSANLMSLGALDFGLIVDGAVIIVENALRHMTELYHDAQRPLSLRERLQTVALSAREMIKPSVYGQAIIILVYVPLLTLTGVEGKTFVPMALTVIIALIFAFILSLTFVPAAIAIWLSQRVEEKEGRIMGWLKARYAPGLERAMSRPSLTLGAGIGSMVLAVAAFSALGQVFLPQLDEGNLLVQALRIPATSVQQSQAMQVSIEKALSKLPEVQFVFSKTGTAELASDPMPPTPPTIL
jgi:cobalt-zinc-cadmium resistance protein CzcA